MSRISIELVPRSVESIEVDVALLCERFPGIDTVNIPDLMEIEYVRAKLDAGADGLFSQPFFDLRLMEVWAELLAGCEVYWGVSPVMTPRQRRWWETKNQAVFPSDFESGAKWNQRFARATLDWARSRGANLYFMPIRTSLGDYLSAIL